MYSGMIDNELIIITRKTFEAFRDSENNADACFLYLHYYSVAKWQQTNKVYSTTNFTVQALNWTKPRLLRAKKTLIEKGLIEDVTAKDDKGKVTGHYIKCNYIFSAGKVEQIKGTENHPLENPPCGKTDTVENRYTNALSNNNKMLKVTKDKCLKQLKEDIISPLEIVTLYHAKCKSLAKVRAVTETRKKHIISAEKQLSSMGETFESLFQRVEASDFLTGRTKTDRPFKADFDWIIKQANLIKIMEGRYDNRYSTADSGNTPADYDEQYQRLIRKNLADTYI